MPFTAQELSWLHRLMNSDDPFERDAAWFFFDKRCAEIRARVAQEREAQREK